MSGASIAAEVTAAIREASAATGAGPLNGTLVRPAAQPANPWDTPAGAPLSIPVSCLVEMYDARQIDGTLIRVEDRRVMVAAEGTEPTVADRLVVGGVSYAIVSVKPEAPGGVALYYVCQCRA